MAVMTSMRTKMHIVLWAVLVLFILSMSIGGLVGGVNIIDELLGRSDPTEVIGVIDGEKIPPEYFNELVSQQLASLRATGQEITDNQVDAIREQVWNSIVRDVLMQSAIKEMDIQATDEEVLFHLRNNPPTFLRSQEIFQTDGLFDPTKYLQAIDNPQGNEWSPIEQFMKYTYIPGHKVEQILRSTAVVTDTDVRNAYIKNNVNYTIEALHITKDAFNPDLYEISDDELLQEYQERKDEFQNPELRNLRLIKWQKSPSSQDSTAVFEDAAAYIAQLRNGEIFSKLANMYTEDPGNLVTPDSGRGGELGWFSKGQMVKPFEAAAFNANVGDIVGPVLSPFGYHIILVNDKKTEDDKEQVNASHILLKIEISQSTRDEIRRQAYLFSYDAQDYGFDVAVDSHAVEIMNATGIEESAYNITSVGRMRDAIRFAFNSEIGSISPVLENDQLYAVFILDSVTPPGPDSFEEVEPVLERDLKRVKQQTLLESLASEIRDKINRGTSFTAIQTEYENIEKVDEVTATLNRGFASIGRNSYITGALLHATEKLVVGPLKTSQGYAIINVLDVSGIDFEDYEIQRNTLRNNLVSNLESSAYVDWMQNLRDNAKIEDLRKFHF